MKEIIQAIRKADPAAIRRALDGYVGRDAGLSRKFDAKWLVGRVDELQNLLPGAELSENDRLRKKSVGAVLSEAMMRHLKVSDHDIARVRGVVASRLVSDDYIEGGHAEEMLTRIYKTFDELKWQLKDLHSQNQIDDDHFYRVWDHAANGAIYFTP